MELNLDGLDMLIGKLLLLICKKKNEVAYQGNDVFSALETNFYNKDTKCICSANRWLTMSRLKT